MPGRAVTRTVPTPDARPYDIEYRVYGNGTWSSWRDYADADVDTDCSPSVAMAGAIYGSTIRICGP